MLDPSKVCVLNDDQSKEFVQPFSVSNAVEFSQRLQQKILRLKWNHLSNDGERVDYKKLREDLIFQEFETETSLLSHVDLSQLQDDKNQSKAFFINVYNTLNVHALARLVHDETTVLQLENFWQRNAYRIGPHIFSLDDMEHGVLRGNKLHPTYKDYFFKAGDPRQAFVHQELDPRIHFALNCGAKSCPSIRLFSGENIDTGLDLATRTFCQDDITIDVQTKHVKMTKILMWYKDDFGPDEKSILLWLSKYLKDDQRRLLSSIIDDSPAFEYSEYDWKIL